MTPQDFISKWNGADGSERANYQLFFNDLCELLGVDKPQPAQADDAHNAYVFERWIDARDGESAGTSRFLDTYKRGHFICESKSFHLGKSAESADRKLFKAKAQAESYARNLPEAEPRPPVLMVVNVGRFIALYAQFKDNDRAYEMYPDRAGYRIAIADLARDDIRERLRLCFADPAALNPERIAAHVTIRVSNALGALARELEATGHPAQAVAGFLTRCLFTMFAEDVGLLPAGGFTQLLARAEARPESLAPNLEDLWRAMDGGAWSLALQAEVAHFNGKLFKTPTALPLAAPQIARLLDAARQDWKHVEPAIFGTLIERALDPAERHALGAHFTPRGYVERLVLPTVIEPLRAEWIDIQTAAIKLDDDGDHKAAVGLVRGFQSRLASLRVLDPACGSGNFLYIALEHLKRLEGDVLEQLAAMNVSDTLDTEGLAVDPHQFLGIERNPHAAAIAELVLWIGHLQWHFRTRGRSQPPRPILRDFRNIECRDAMLEWSAVEAATDADGTPLTRWDGVTFKPHPATGRPVPDEAARVPVERYRDPRAAAWPDADFVVGNPPFLGASTLRSALGDGYVEALRAAHPGVPESADLVMFWWDHAARLLTAGRIRRFGFITTNSLAQTFNRRVLEAHLSASPRAAAPSPQPSPPRGEGVNDTAQKAGEPATRVDALYLACAIPDHPWVDSADGAAVRVAMTVAAPALPSPARGRGAGGEGRGSTTRASGRGAEGEGTQGRLLTVVRETPGHDGEIDIVCVERVGRIHADLRIGANVAAALPLRANAGLSNRGFQLIGAGFIVTAEEAARLASPLVRDYRNGKDLTDKPRGVKVIDTWGCDEAGLRAQHPAIWQWLHDQVKPERDANKRASYRDNWWLFGEPRRELRKMLAGLPRYIATVETAKHRVFQFLDAAIAPDNKLIAIALDDAYFLGVLSSRVHGVWALAAGSRLGVGNDPVYVKSTCFERFPFPAATPEQAARIRDLAERLDAHRKRVLSPRPPAGEEPIAGLTLTGLYNVLEKLRAGEALNAREQAIHEQGLAGVLKHLHDELDAAVLDAYGWGDLISSAPVALPQARAVEPRPSPPAPLPQTGEGSEAELLTRLVALNAARAREEGAGQVRWLRPDFQSTAAPAAALDLSAGDDAVPAAAAGPDKQPWPATLPERLGAVAALLAAAPAPLAPADIARHFTGKGVKAALPDLLAALVAVARARAWPDGRFGAG